MSDEKVSTGSTWNVFTAFGWAELPGTEVPINVHLLPAPVPHALPPPQEPWQSLLEAAVWTVTLEQSRLEMSM